MHRAGRINKEELSLLKHTKSLLKSTKFHCDALMVLLLWSVAMPSASHFITLSIKTAMPK